MGFSKLIDKRKVLIEKMEELVRKSEDAPKPYPVSIASLEVLLGKAINGPVECVHTGAIKKNIAYNLQYLEYLDRCLLDLKLSSPIKKQLYKTFILFGCSIVECLIFFLLIKKGHYRKIHYEFEYCTSGNEKKLQNGVTIKIDNHVYQKLDKPRLDKMDFHSMLKKADSKKLLGQKNVIYSRLKTLKKLRNKIHLQDVERLGDTDWNSFEPDDVKTMAEVLYNVFTGDVFQPSSKERGYFDYLRRHFTS